MDENREIELETENGEDDEPDFLLVRDREGRLVNAETGDVYADTPDREDTEDDDD